MCGRTSRALRALVCSMVGEREGVPPRGVEDAEMTLKRWQV